jgi:predicted HTH domain antitoxin
MCSAERYQKVLVPTFYKSEGALLEDALRALLNFKPELKVEIGVELYCKEAVSLSRAAEIAGLDLERFKDVLKARGLKLSSYLGTESEIELNVAEKYRR